MIKRHSYFTYVNHSLVLTALTAMFCVGTPAIAQTPAVQNDRPVQDNDKTRQELARFDQFLEDHPQIAEQLRNDPSLVDNPEYEKSHPELQAYLADHPEIREQIKQNPNVFMRDEDRYGRHEGERSEVARFNQFLDSHPEIAEQLRKDPSLVDNPEYEKNHPALQAYLADHPQIREEIKQHPDAFMRQEDRYDRHEGNRDDITRGELARFNEFLDSHREIAEQLRKDPSLVDNPEFERNHPALHAYLQDHPEIREQLKEHPDAFMRDEDRYDRREGGHNDITRGELARFNQFLDSHREIAEQLRRDPSLVDNGEFTRNHPALYAYLQDHPEMRDEIKQNPNVFMRDEERYERQENGHGDDMDRDLHERAARFGQFLNGHTNVGEQLSRDPSLVKNQEFMENHPELRDYLKDNPDVQKELLANPPTFVQSAKQLSGDKARPAQTPTPSSTTDPKPKQ
jgi:hypothetical protein